MRGLPSAGALLDRLWMLPVPSTRLERTALGAFSVLLALLGTLVLGPVLHRGQFLLFYLAILISALGGGLLAAMVATALSTLAAGIWVLGADGELGMQVISPLLAFSLVGLLVSWLASTARASVHRLSAQAGELQRTSAELCHALAGARLLDRAGVALSLDPQSETAALRRLCELVVQEHADYCICWLANPQGSLEPAACARRPPGDIGLVEEVAAAFAAGSPLIEQSLRSGHPYVATPTAGGLTLMTSNREQLALLRRLRPASEIGAPLAARGRNVGFLVVGFTEGSLARPESAGVSLVRELAGRAALLLDNAALLAQAEEAVASRDRVLAVVAHDLRNPLQVIASAVELLGSRAGSAGERPAQVVRDAVERSERLVGDLLDLARLESDHFPLEIAAVDLCDVAREAYNAARVRGEAEGVAVELDLEVGSVRALGDRFRLLEALTNLVRNAMEHASSRVVIAVRAGVEAVLSVRDDGPGIGPAARERIFDRFWRAAHDADGLGLGLSIVKGIVEAHRGRVWVESRPGEGSVFLVALPLAGDK